MDQQQLINLAFSVGFAALGWFARELWSAVKELKNDLSLLRESLPKEYVMADNYREDIREIKNMFTKIFDKLENKSDK